MPEGLKALTIDEFKELIKKDDVLLLDTRDSKEFTQGYIPGSISIGLDGRFAEWAGSLLPFDKPMVLPIFQASTNQLSSRQ